MPPVVNAGFRLWLKVSTTIKLSSDTAVVRLAYKGITNFPSLVDFDKNSIEALPSIGKTSIPAIAEDVPNGVKAEVEIPGANTGSILVRRLIVMYNAAK